MRDIPREPGDSTLALLRDPYRFIATAARRHQADLFETRLLLQPAICMTGPLAAALFYDRDKFRRHGAMPMRVQKTLLGAGGVQSLDGPAHRHRKHLLMSFMTTAGIDRLVARMGDEWHRRASEWRTRETVDLYAASQEMLMRTICAWVGVPLPEAELRARTRDVAALFDGAGALGPRHWRARGARRRSEAWLAGMVEARRAGGPAGDTPFDVIAFHTDSDGLALSPSVAAVELLNLLRPTVAVSVYIVSVAHALATYPTWSERLDAADPATLEYFVQEVRRFYPFFPSIAALTCQAFEWQGYDIPAARWVLLDLYGTSRDPRSWETPDEFRPERFAGAEIGAFTLVAQGGGDHHTHHRCAGEWVTIALMKQAAAFLAGRLRYAIVSRDLSLDYGRLPCLPRGGLALRDVRPPT